MGPTTLDEPREPISFSNANIVMFAVGLLIVGGFAAAKIYAEKRRKHSDGNP